jgi:hypothetical protein
VIARASGASAAFFFGLLKRPGKNQIIVSLGAVLAAKRTQQNEWENEQFKQPAAMRPANIQASAGRAAPQQKESIVGHGRQADSKS